MTTGFFQQVDQVKAVLSSSRPVEQKLDQVKPLLIDPDVQRAFWDLIDDPEWLPVLSTSRMFEGPPKPERTADGAMRFPSWGASKYLARVARSAPFEVTRVLSQIKTDNVSILGDIFDAARSMPIKAAAELAPNIRAAALENNLWVHFKDASDLCVRLATEGELEEALSLAEALFSPTKSTRRGASKTGDVYWYKEGLQRVTQAIVSRAADQFLSMLCDWLEELVRSTKPVDADTGNDHSYIWRPAIEDHEQNHDYEIAGLLVGCVRNGFEDALRQEQITLSEAWSRLQDRSLMVFRRIGLHLVAEFGERSLALVSQAILDASLFDDYRVKHEYCRLLGRQFGNIKSEDQQLWYRWVDKGPEMSQFDEDFQLHKGRDATAEDRRVRIDYWKFEKLHCIRAFLAGSEQEFYLRMVSEHGKPEMADLNFMVRVQRPEPSKVTVEQLAGMTLPDALDFLRSWQQTPHELRSFSFDSLASVFGDYISSDPEVFSRKALFLIDREQGYVSAFLRQISGAVKSDKNVDLLAVLGLCSWIVESKEAPEWQPARDEVSELIQASCQAQWGQKPRYSLDEFRDPFWRLLERLQKDPAESHIVRDISKDDLRLHDYLDLGINSSRGKAVEAALDFGRWVALHNSADGDKSPGGFASIPEILELLDWQLAPSNQSVEAMAIIGSRIGLIHWIDPSWLAENAGRLFALRRIEETPKTAFGWVAWNSFLVWVRPHLVFYQVLKEQYEYAVHQATMVQVDNQDYDQPMFRLGEHLMVLYGRGQLSLVDKSLQEFLVGAHSAIRRHAIGFAGSSLGNDSNVPVDVIKRFMALWREYWEGQGKSDTQADPTSPSFGTWFASGAFPPEWSIAALHDFVAVAPVPEPEHFVMERLREVAHLDPLRSVQILNAMLRGDREGWRIHGWIDHARAILQEAMKLNGPSKDSAAEVIDYLGRRGYSDFGVLLANRE